VGNFSFFFKIPGYSTRVFAVSLLQEELCQDLLEVPDCIQIGRHPESKAGLENMKLLLLLLLGCAVQCPNKEYFIHRIKELNVDMQHSLVDCIKRVSTFSRMRIPTDFLAF